MTQREQYEEYRRKLGGTDVAPLTAYETRTSRNRARRQRIMLWVIITVVFGVMIGMAVKGNGHG